MLSFVGSLGTIQSNEIAYLIFIYTFIYIFTYLYLYCTVQCKYIYIYVYILRLCSSSREPQSMTAGSFPSQNNGMDSGWCRLTKSRKPWEVRGTKRCRRLTAWLGVTVLCDSVLVLSCWFVDVLICWFVDMLFVVCWGGVCWFVVWLICWYVVVDLLIVDLLICW